MLRKPVKNNCFGCAWPEGFKCPRCGQTDAYFYSNRHLYQYKSCGYQASLTSGTVFHKTRTPLTKWFWLIWLMGRQKSGISMLSMQRMLEIKTYKTVWTMGHKIRKALADRDAHYKLAGLIEMDDTYFGAPKPGKHAAGGPPARPKWWWRWKPRGISRDLLPCIWFPRVSGQEIQAMVRARLVAEVVVKTDVGKGIASWMLCPTVMSGSFPVRGKRHRRSCPGSYLDRQCQRKYSWCLSWCQPKAAAPLPGGILLPLQPALLGTTNV